MFANRPVLGDFKENVKSLAPEKASTRNSQKGLKPRSLNSFNDSTNLMPNKKPVFGLKTGSCSKTVVPDNKENSKQKVKEPDIKVKPHEEEDSWSDIEEMHIYIEPDDDYEDILPKHERIQKQDIDSLFFDYFSVNYTELTVDRLPSPLKDYETLDIPDLPEYSPLMPDITTSLFDDTELDFIPLP